MTPPDQTRRDAHPRGVAVLDAAVGAATRGGLHWRDGGPGLTADSGEPAERQPETPAERHARRVAWGARWSETMRDAWLRAEQTETRLATNARALMEGHAQR